MISLSPFLICAKGFVGHVRHNFTCPPLICANAFVGRIRHNFACPPLICANVSHSGLIISPYLSSASSIVPPLRHNPLSLRLIFMYITHH